jgi:hypothetical protein
MACCAGNEEPVSSLGGPRKFYSPRRKYFLSYCLIHREREREREREKERERERERER